MTRSRFTLVLVFSVVVFVSQTLAKPQSDQLQEIQTEDSNTPGGKESFPLNASASFLDATSSPRKRLTRAVNNRYVQTPGIGRHVIHSHARTWYEARKICQQEGGDLAVINSKAESQALAELIAESYPHYSSADSKIVLIGFNDIYQEGHYVTIDGRSLEGAGFAEWGSGEPNDLRRMEDCGSIRKDGLLNDERCDKKYAFACELPLVDEVGPRGPVGPRGIPGIKGDAGIQGPTGRVGQKGETGAKGAPGAAGENGTKGATGSPGLDGLKGNKGDPGATGPPGRVGPVGPPGSDGAQGLKGDQGEPGTAGSAGLRGEKGDKGTAGLSGSPGNNGVPGHNGFNGKDGSAGVPGLDGSKGEPGDKGGKGGVGAHGPIGLTGPPGPPGPPGKSGFVNDTVCLALLSSLEQHPDGLIDGGGAARACFPNSEQRDGLKEAPAKTCKDLFLAYPDKPNGKYWIDPNGDDVSDAIQAYCDAEKRETCITPEASRSPIISYTGDEREVWLSDIEDGMQIKYTARSSQISALQLLSNHAAQSITYHCLMKVGYFDTRYERTARELKLLAWNDLQLEFHGSRQFRYDVISDGCRDRLDGWQETVIAHRTEKPARLPVTDVGWRDVGRPGQNFSVEIGDVCYE